MIPGLVTNAPSVYFRRRFRTRLRRVRGRLDAVPLVDIALLLFLFFLLRSSFVLQPGLRVELPTAPFGDGTPYRSLVVTVSQEGMVFFNDQRTTLEGLRSAFQQAVHDQPDAPLILEADGRVLNSTLVEIYTMARRAGVREVVLATRVAPAAEGETP